MGHTGLVCLPAILFLVSLPVPAAWACDSGTSVVDYCDPLLTYEGCCDGQGLYWCEEDETCMLDCSANPYCGWDGAMYNCATAGGGDPSGTFDHDCPQDEDGDGSYFPEDCDSENPAVYPNTPEVCDGEADNNCNGVDDPNELDADGDGYSLCDEDCDEGNPTIYPGAEEICGDAIDSDCGGDLELEQDGDGDGVLPCAGDCDDTKPGVHPGATEMCNDGLDNDCDGDTDAYDPDCGGDDDDDVAGDDDRRDGPYGLRCALNPDGGVAGVALTAGLALAVWLRRRGT